MFEDPYPGYEIPIPEAEQAGVVLHEGSHYEDFAEGSIKRDDKFSRNSPTERKADEIQDSTRDSVKQYCQENEKCE